MSHLSSHRFDATELAARDGIAAVMKQLAAQGLSGRMAGDVELALAEVVNNVVEHGYAGIPGGEVHVDSELSDGWLELRVSDTGRPLPGGHLPPVRATDLNRLRTELPEGGWLVADLRSDRRAALSTGRHAQHAVDAVPPGRQAGRRRGPGGAPHHPNGALKPPQSDQTAA